MPRSRSVSGRKITRPLVFYGRGAVVAAFKPVADTGMAAHVRCRGRSQLTVHPVGLEEGMRAVVLVVLPPRAGTQEARKVGIIVPKLKARLVDVTGERLAAVPVPVVQVAPSLLRAGANSN